MQEPRARVQQCHARKTQPKGLCPSTSLGVYILSELNLLCLSFAGTNQPLEAFAHTLPEISSPTMLDDPLTGSVLDTFHWDATNTFENLLDMPTQPHGGEYLQPEIRPPPTASPIPGLLVTPPSPEKPSSDQFNQASNVGSGFLQQDNARLRNSNDQLRDEVEELRRQHGETQAQLNELRDRLGPLDSSLQELLYQNGVRNGDQEVVMRLLAICDTVVEMKKSFGSRAGKG